MTGRKTNSCKWFRVLPLILFVFLARHEVRAQGKEIRIAAAADLKFAMGEFAETFEKQSRTKVNVTYGSSGNFFSQLQNGAPFDLFFSADIEYPKKLEAAGLAEPGTLYESVKAKLVYGENISQAAQFVQSGNAQAGIVAMSLAVSPAMREGKHWEIPAEMHPAIEQGAIVLKDAQNKEAARAFLEFVKSTAGRATLAEYGFAFPEKAGQQEKR